MGKGLRAAERRHARRVAAGISDDKKALAALGSKLFAAQAEVRALRAEREALAELRVLDARDRDALRARVAELERLGDDLTGCCDDPRSCECVKDWRKAVPG